jgi:mono/diheme cytochrome c family protein
MMRQRRALWHVGDGRCCRDHGQLGRALAGLLLCLVITGCAMAPSRQMTITPPQTPIAAASTPEALAVGARLYQQYCVHCHGTEGKSSIASPLDQYGHAWHHPDSFLTQTIREGTTPARPDLAIPDVAMPSFEAVLTAEEIHILIAFFKTSWTPDQQQLQWERTQRADLQMY